MHENEFKDLNTNIKKPEANALFDDMDPDYEAGRKKHRLTKQKLDAFFQNLIHPFTLIMICSGFLGLFGLFRYLSIGFPDNTILKCIYSDLHTCIGYIATAAISCIVTEFIQSLRK
nr:MAG TPA: hypothetical protein [Caudoviricetes sp.]